MADKSAYRVVEGDRPLDLTPKLLDVLFYFLEHPGRLITKEDLLDAVWPGANVTDNALAQAISELRDALGDTPSAPRFIRTISRRGYRFIGDVQQIQEPQAAAAASSPRASDRGTVMDHGPEDPRLHPGTRGIAVLDFTNVTGDADVAWLAAGIAETVTSDLGALGRFRVIDRFRVVQTARRTSGSMHEIGAALNVPLIVTGSYQRSGPHLRITARIVDLVSGDAVADAKVDGMLQDVFALQDDIVSSFARELGVASPRPHRSAGRETSSLEAYRAYTEGWLKLETLDTSLTPEAIRDFERAISLDPAYALAHTGLANAAFVAYEMTHVTRTPDTPALSAGIEHARRAIRLDDQLAEAHATLSFLLVSAGKLEEARAAAARAVAIDPDNWRHQYRLAHATWGTARIRAAERTLALYPEFSYAHFETTMVHVARGRLDVAEDLARQGIATQDRQARAGNRFPAIGFYWLLGAIEMARDRHDEAIADFDREVDQSTSRRLYGPEYAALALAGRGHAKLALGDHAAALESFRRADAIVPGYIASQLGMALVFDALGDTGAAVLARQQADEGRLLFERSGRVADALVAGARHAVAASQPEMAIARLEQLCNLQPPSHYGWTMPIDPLLRRLQEHPGFVGVLARLAERAR